MNLQLSLKTKWFEMTKAGIKTEDYREITPYWVKRLCKNYKGDLSEICNDFEEAPMFADYPDCLDDMIIKFNIILKNFTKNTMTLDYPKSSDSERILKFEHAGIEIRTGNPEWGAEPDKLYFVIKHGAILE